MFRCNPGCVLVGQSADGDSEESVTLNNPVAATYIVLVDGFYVPAGTTTYNYIDVFTKTPSFGSISVTDANALRPAGASWTVPATVTAAEAPTAGRVLAGERRGSNGHEPPRRVWTGHRPERHAVAYG